VNSRGVSLLDAAYHHSVDCYVVWRTMPRERSVWWRLLQPGFWHVEVWKYIPPGAWLRFDTSVELTAVEVYANAPWELIGESETPTFLRYQALVPHGSFRQPFYFGPLTCVQGAASFLGVRLPFWCRTPYQLYRLLKRKHEPQISKTAG
jgi:hypothetical protein